MTHAPAPAAETPPPDSKPAPAAFDAFAVSEAAARLSAARLLVPCCAFLAAVLTAGTDALAPEGLAAGALAGGGVVVYGLSRAPSSVTSFFAPRYAAPLAGFVLCFFAFTGAAGALPEGAPWSALSETPWRRIIPVLTFGAMFALIMGLAHPNARKEEPYR